MARQEPQHGARSKTAKQKTPRDKEDRRTQPRAAPCRKQPPATPSSYRKEGVSDELNLETFGKLSVAMMAETLVRSTAPADPVHATLLRQKDSLVENLPLSARSRFLAKQRCIGSQAWCWRRATSAAARITRPCATWPWARMPRRSKHK